MKNFMSIIIPLFTVSLCSGQVFTPKANNSKGFQVSMEHKTGDSAKIDGEIFDVYKTKSGSEYVQCISFNSGKSYPVWLGKSTQYIYNKRPVRQSKKGIYFILRLNKKGNPYPIYLNKQ